METGMVATIVIGTAIAGVFFIGARRMLRNFARGQCGGCSGGCHGHCHEAAGHEKKA